MKEVKISVTKRLPNSEQLKLDIAGTVTLQVGSNEDIADMLLEAELHANDGPARIHIFVSKV